MKILADSLRPIKLSDVVGQEHLIGNGKIINNLIKNKKMFSIILYGKPGTGKTSLAYAISNELNMKTRFLNATINKKEDFDNVIEEAKFYGDLILVVDEIHRMNKDKQDLLLPYIEKGTILLIGLTSSNPYHSINPAIRSRVQIFELHELNDNDILKILKRACSNLENIKIDKDSLNHIVSVANGDARSALNLLEMAYYSTKDYHVTKELLQNINSSPNFYYDKNEDGHFDVLSALQKSIRGSDVDATLHYIARLLEVGDLESIFRRLSVIAYEDIGLANPGIGPRLNAAIAAARLVGMPEARIPIGTIAIEMALSPKSNSAYLALNNAINDLHRGNFGSIPSHIKNHSSDYKYPHDYPKSWVCQQYLPDELKHAKYYVKKDNLVENNLNKVHEEMRK